MMHPAVRRDGYEVLRGRETPEEPDRIALSAATRAGLAPDSGAVDVERWIEERLRAHAFRVERIPFDALEGWSFEENGNLRHRSGRFFSVEGLHVREEGEPHGDGPAREWHQPIIRQPEIGILGILAKEIDGVLHFLMQAKMEPGNPRLVQLSPTVQATRSNYTGAHRGGGVRYLEYFLGGAKTVLADSLQSEHGWWFHHKSNRNMIVETDRDVPAHDDFRWLTLGEIGALLHRDNVVNMDARSVLACLPFRDPAGRALHSDVQLLSWFTGERARHRVRAEPVPLAGLPGWKRGEYAIEHEEGLHFTVMAVSVAAGNREVPGWTQPLFEPVDRGLVAFLTRTFDGVPHVLLHARVEGGFLDTVELGPTVQCTPSAYDRLPSDRRPPFLDQVLDADPARVRYRAVHSEEGGRFHNAESVHLLVEADEGLTPAELPAGYVWATPAQLTSLTRHGRYLTVQARTLLACLNAAKASPA